MDRENQALERLVPAYDKRGAHARKIAAETTRCSVNSHVPVFSATSARWVGVGLRADRVVGHPAAHAALRASPPRPVTTRIAIDSSMRCMPGPTWRTAIA